MIATKLAPWCIASAVKAAAAPMIFALNIQAAYWQTWHDVFREARR